MARWNFPGNQDGQVKGVADAGIENFNGKEMKAEVNLQPQVEHLEKWAKQDSEF